MQCVCDFIETQAQQKPYLQTKDLHTSIVAAFQTLLVWVLDHPHLLAHEVYLTELACLYLSLSLSMTLTDFCFHFKFRVVLLQYCVLLSLVFLVVSL